MCLVLLVQNFEDVFVSKETIIIYAFYMVIFDILVGSRNYNDTQRSLKLLSDLIV